MKNLAAAALVLVLLGGGCSRTEANDVAVQSDQQEIVTGDYALPIAQDLSFQRNGDFVRIQNFQSDTKDFGYPDGSFFIEINKYPDLTRDVFASKHGMTDEVQIGGKTVVQGTNRIVPENSWPGHSYFNETNHVAIYLYYESAKGSELAQAVVDGILWKE